MPASPLPSARRKRNRPFSTKKYATPRLKTGALFCSSMGRMDQRTITPNGYSRGEAVRQSVRRIDLPDYGTTPALGSPTGGAVSPNGLTERVLSVEWNNFKGSERMPSLTCKGGVGEGFAVPGTIWYDPGRIRTIQMVGLLRIRPTFLVIRPCTANPLPALPL